MEELTQDSQQPGRLLAGWKPWQYFLLGMFIHVSALILFESTITPLLIEGAPGPLSLIHNILLGKNIRPVLWATPVHELANFLFSLNYTTRKAFPVCLFLLLLQAILFGFCFARSVQKQNGISPGFLISYAVMSGFNSVILWLSALWIGLLRNSEWRRPVTERKSLIGDGDMPGAGFMAYLFRGLYLCGRIAVPGGILGVVLLILAEGPLSPSEYIYVFIFLAVFCLGFVGYLLLCLTSAFGYYPDSLLFIPIAVPLLIFAVFAWQCVKAGCIPWHYKRLLFRFSLVNSGLFLFVMIDSLFMA